MRSTTKLGQKPRRGLLKGTVFLFDHLTQMSVKGQLLIILCKVQAYLNFENFSMTPLKVDANSESLLTLGAIHR